MRNALQAATWKRLTLVSILAVAISTGMIAPISSGHAIPPPQDCSALGQSTLVIYYQTAARTDAGCMDVLYPCPFESPTSYCTRTPYKTTFCGLSCSLH